MAAFALPSTGSELLATWAGHALLLWTFGLLFGWLLPRPNFRGWNLKTLLLATPVGVWVRRTLLAWQGALILRHIWYRVCLPGTFRSLVRSLWVSLADGRLRAPAAAAPTSEVLPASGILDEREAPDWHVTSDDLRRFQEAVGEGGASGPPGASPWTKMLSKQWPGLTYTAYRRTLPSGKTEYKSTTVCEDAAAPEFLDFYLDDDTRPAWDSMVVHTALVEAGPPAQRCQVVRWVRAFPFAFISKREYVIARRVFRGADGTIYGVTKGIDHPAVPRSAEMVRMQSYFSAWASRPVACPRGSGRPACETTLLHFEDFGIPENLARFAVRHGMAGFVKKMVPQVARFVAVRRARCLPEDDDTAGFGYRSVAPLPALCPTADECGTAPATPGARSIDDSASELSRSGGKGGGMPRTPSLRRFGMMMVASAAAIVLARSESSADLAAAPSPAKAKAAAAAAPAEAAAAPDNMALAAAPSPRHHGKARAPRQFHRLHPGRPTLKLRHRGISAHAHAAGGSPQQQHHEASAPRGLASHPVRDI